MSYGKPGFRIGDGGFDNPSLGVGYGKLDHGHAGFAYKNSYAKAWVARNLVKPTVAQGKLLDTLFTALASAGLFTWADQGKIFGVPHNEQAATVDIVQSRFDGFLINGQRITLNRGLAGDGAATYQDLIMNPVTAGSLLHAQNDNGMIYGVLTSLAVTPGSVASADIGNGSFRAGRGNGDKSVPIRAHSSATDTAFNNAQGAEPAIFGISREGSTTLKSYKRGLGLVNTFATASAAMNSEAFGAGRAGGAGFGVNQIAFQVIGKQFTLTQFTNAADAFYNYFHDTAVGAM